MTKYIMHSDRESHSKYKGGFINGKNTSAYNHDYYIHNKDKWKNQIAKSLQQVGDKLTNVYRDVKNAWQNNQNELEKYFQTKRGNSKNKYLYRVKNGTRYRYFYSENSYRSFLDNIRKKNRDWSIDEDIEVINQHYGEDGYTLNCGSCSVAYDMRRRGYDVVSSKRYGILASNVEKMYKGGKFQKHSKTNKNNVEKLYDQISKYGNGSRGLVSVAWSIDGSRHMMNFEVVNGETIIIDAQKGKKYTKGFYTRMEDRIDWSAVIYMRTDNLELTDAAKDFDMYTERGKEYGSKRRN